MDQKITLKKINYTIMVFLMISVIFLILLIANQRQYFELGENTKIILKNLSIVAVSFLFASLFIKFTNKTFLNYFKNIEVEQKLLLVKSYSFVVYFIAILIILGNIGVTIQNLTLIIGIAATGLAFTIREILVNYFAWFMFLTKKPFRIGDHVEIDNVEGKVIHIGTFYILLDETPEESSDYIRVPNKKFLENSIINLGKGPFTFNVNYPLHKDLDVNKLNDIEKILKKEVKIKLNFQLITDQTSVKINIMGKAKDYNERNILRTKIIKKLIELIPFKS
jgi:MscS family membrane protein